MRLPTPYLAATAAALVARQAANSSDDATAGLNNTIVPSAPPPMTQIHCTSPIYCPGPLLQTVQLSGLYADSKTFVDKPLLKSQDDVVAAFAALGDGKGGNVTYSQLQTFLDQNFGQEGDDLVEADLGEEFIPEPRFLGNVSNEVVRDWVKQVHGYWPILARTTNTSSSTIASNDTSDAASLDERADSSDASNATENAAELIQSNGTDATATATSSFIPFKSPRTFVIPGQRFREMYYWDSYFVILGLLRSQLPSVALAMLDNFADLIEDYGFIPNGNRVYYLNRSQPPMFAQMVDVYVNYTGDIDVLERLLPLMEKEWDWWNTNRTIEVTSSYSSKTYNVSHYDVDTSAPRPESYLVDWQTVELAAAEQGLNFTEEDKARLYADIASAAESGHDFSLQRWSKMPTFSSEVATETTSDTSSPSLRRQVDEGNSTSTEDVPTTASVPPAVSTAAALRYLNTAQQIPVDLNAILYKNELTLARFRNITVSNAVDSSSNTTSGVTIRANSTLSALWFSRASARREAILDLHWDAQILSFADYNLTSSSRSDRWSASNLWPFWAGVLPDEFTDPNQTLEKRGASLQRAFAGVRYLIDRYNGSLSTTLVATDQQWDFPNVWAPHTQVAIDALRGLPQDLVKAGGVATPAPNGTFELIPRSSIPAMAVPLQNTTLAEGDDATVALLNQLGVSSADQLPLQPLVTDLNTSSHANESLIGQTSSTSGLQYVGASPSNIGNATSDEELWTETLIRSLANRFVASALCSWYATGGQLNLSSTEARDRWSPQPTTTSTSTSTSASSTGTSPEATNSSPSSSDEDNVTPGHMFEKYSQTSISNSGTGGEYEVQVGFGWTNGVSIWLAAELGQLLQEPVCAG